MGERNHALLPLEVQKHNIRERVKDIISDLEKRLEILLRNKEQTEAVKLHCSHLEVEILALKWIEDALKNLILSSDEKELTTEKQLLKKRFDNIFYLEYKHIQIAIKEICKALKVTCSKDKYGMIYLSIKRSDIPTKNKK